MSYTLNSLRGVIWGFIWGTTIGLSKGDTRSLDYGSYGDCVGLYWVVTYYKLSIPKSRIAHLFIVLMWLQYGEVI